MKHDIAHAANTHDLNLLRVYEKFVSVDFTPHAIKKVLAALTGREDYDQMATLPQAYESLTSTHLDAYHRVLHALGNGHPAWSPMAQAAARYPQQTDAFIEHAVRGAVEPREVVESINEAGSNSSSDSIVSIMGDRAIPQPASHAVTI